ncbi:LolA family protein [Frigoribacterium sp. 2-23]|uniref:LolA family protein n=1 Tax=Frigoribacterium sp. 2-23 TaxID=3415006 RepID=UPI003C6FB6DE
MRSKTRRWIPAVAVPVAVLAASLAMPAFASASGSLPSKSPEQILSLLASSHGTPFSGTVEEKADLGLPTLPSSDPSGGSSSTEPLGLLTGSHTARVFSSGDGAQRVQIVTDLAEEDIVRSGRDVWVYDSKKSEATHTVLPEALAHDRSSGTPRTPAEVVDTILSEVEPVSTLTTAADVSVAGRDAYELVITPKDDTTLVGSVSVAVDSETGLPLRVVVAAKGQTDPALSVGFQSIDVSAPPASTFTFTPPAGAKVTERSAPSSAPRHDRSTSEKPTVIGSGWSSVVGAVLATRDPSAGSPAAGQQAGAVAKALEQAFTPVSGGKVLQTALFSVYLTTDGHLYVGAVPADRLVSLVAS